MGAQDETFSRIMCRVCQREIEPDKGMYHSPDLLQHYHMTCYDQLNPRPKMCILIPHEQNFSDAIVSPHAATAPEDGPPASSSRPAGAAGAGSAGKTRGTARTKKRKSRSSR